MLSPTFVLLFLAVISDVQARFKLERRKLQPSSLCPDKTWFYLERDYGFKCYKGYNNPIKNSKCPRTNYIDECLPAHPRAYPAEVREPEELYYASIVVQYYQDHNITRYLRLGIYMKCPLILRKEFHYVTNDELFRGRDNVLLCHFEQMRQFNECTGFYSIGYSYRTEGIIALSAETAPWVLCEIDSVYTPPHRKISPPKPKPDKCINEIYKRLQTESSKGVSVLSLYFVPKKFHGNDPCKLRDPLSSKKDIDKFSAADKAIITPLTKGIVSPIICVRELYGK